MTSWRLWFALQDPPASHPLFRRVVAVEYALQWHLRVYPSLTRLAQIAFFPVLGVLFCINPQVVLIAILIVPVSMVLFVFVSPVLLLLLMNVLGAFWSSLISTAIVKERESRTYDLLCLLPDGTLGVHWALSSACMHRGVMFDSLLMAVRTLLILGLIILGVMLLITVGIAFDVSGGREFRDAVRTVLDVIWVIIGYYTHYIQLVVLSPLTAIFTAVHVRSQLEARLFAPIIFLAIQVGTYAATLVIAFNILPLFYGSLSMSNPFVYLGLPFIYLLVFWAIRELVIFMLWGYLRQQLNVHTSDSNPLAHLSSL